MPRSHFAHWMILVLGVGCLGTAFGLPSRIIRPPGREPHGPIYTVYWIGKTRNAAGAQQVLKAIFSPLDLVQLVGWLSLGRLERPELRAAAARLPGGSAHALDRYRAVALARLAAAGALPVVRTTADVTRKTEAFLRELGTSIPDLNRLREEFASHRQSIDTLDNPPLRQLALNGLSEIVADAKGRGIDTAKIEARTDFRASAVASLRLAPSPLPPSRIS